MPDGLMGRLHHWTSNLLIEGLPTATKQALDDALSKGSTPEELLAVARRITGGPGQHKGAWTYLAIHAYLFPGATFVE